MHPLEPESLPDRLLHNTRHAVELLGGPAATARLLECAQPSVTSWCMGRSRPREEHVRRLADLVLVSPATMRYGDVEAWLMAAALRRNLVPLALGRAADGHIGLAPMPKLGACLCGALLTFDSVVGQTFADAPVRCLSRLA